MKNGLVAASLAVLGAIAASLPAQQASPRVYSVQESNTAPQIDLWLSQLDYRYGDRIIPFFDTERGAYVTILRVTSDGALSVLYPRRPRDQAPFEREQLANNRVPFSSFDGRFNVAESDGVGFVFAVASYGKFNYSYFTQAGDWNRGRLAYEGGIGDPFEMVRRFIDRTLGDDGDFSMDYVSYRVSDYGTRSRYATRYSYNSYDDYYDSCLTAFGYRYTSYCRNGYAGYYGPIIVAQPGTPKPRQSSERNLAGKRIKPVTGDPLVDGAPTIPQAITQGRFPSVDAQSAAEATRRSRMLRDATPRDRMPTQVDPIPVYRGGSQTASPRAEPAPSPEPSPRAWLERQPVMRAEPRVEPPRIEQPRVEQQRADPRPMQASPQKIEIRNEPRRAAPVPIQQLPARTMPAPATKDDQK